MGHILALLLFLAGEMIGGIIGVFTICACISAGQADDREVRLLSRMITCADCGHRDDSCRWCRLLDMPIDEDKYCCWAEEDRNDT